MSTFGGKIPKNYFLLLLLVIIIHLNETAPDKVAKECHLEIYTQSRRQKETPKRIENVDATLLSDKPDCSIYRVTNKQTLLDIVTLKNWFQTPDVIKIVRMVQKNGQDRKSMDLLAHEVDMFELAKKHRSENVIKVDKSMVFKETIYIRMEMGEFDLQKKLEYMNKKWSEVKPQNTNVIVSDIYEMIDDMATVLADFNRYAVHFALKTENWVYVKVKDENDPNHKRWKLKLKLIDLQTAATTVGGRVLNPHEQRVYFCKERKDEAFVPSHASPEHIQFCKNRPKGHSQDQQPDPSQHNVPQLHLPQLYLPQHNLPPPNAQQHDEQPQQQDAEKFYPELTAKADIWSMGVVICELLAQTPIMSQYGYGYEIVKAVFVPVEATEAKKPIETEKQQKEKPMLKVTKSLGSAQHHAAIAQNKFQHANTFDEHTKVYEMKVDEAFLKERAKEKKVEKAAKELNTHFPFIFKLLKNIFQSAKDRPEPQAIREYIKRVRSSVKEGASNVLHQANQSQMVYVETDEIQKVEPEKDLFLTWKISGVKLKNKEEFCKHCFFKKPNPNYVKSEEVGGSVKNGAMEEEDVTKGNVTNNMPDSPRKNSDIAANAQTRRKSVQSAEKDGSVKKGSAEKGGSVTKKTLNSPRNLANIIISPRKRGLVFPVDHLPISTGPEWIGADMK